MIKPSAHIKELSKNIRTQIAQANNIDTALKAAKTEKAERINVYIDDTLAELKALGFTFSKYDDNNEDYTRFEVKVKGHSEYEGGIVVFHHTKDNANVIFNTSVGRYIKDNELFITVYGDAKQEHNKAIKQMEKFAELLSNHAKFYEVIKEEYQDYAKDIKEIVSDADDKIRKVKDLAKDPLSIKSDLMEAVALEVYKTMKGGSYKFKPVTFDALIARVEKNKDFFFSMDGQADTMGERYALNTYGDNSSAYKQVLYDVLNSEDIKSAGKNLLYPFGVEKGGWSAYAMKEVKIDKVGKNFKTTIVPVSYDDGDIFTDGNLIRPRKKIGKQTDNNPISDVFIYKGALLAMLSLFTTELDQYMKLFK